MAYHVTYKIGNGMKNGRPERAFRSSSADLLGQMGDLLEHIDGLLDHLRQSRKGAR